MNRHHGCPLQRAFSLVELLVVIAIISVLAAMLLPTMEQMLDRTRLTACAGQLKQIGTAAGTYDTDFNCLPLLQQGSNAWAPKCYLNAPPLATGFIYLAKHYVGAPNMVGCQDWRRGEHGLFECPARAIPSGLPTGNPEDRTRIWHMSYLNGALVHTWYGLWNNTRAYRVSNALQSECTEVYGYRGQGTRDSGRMGILTNRTTHHSALPLFFDDTTYTPGSYPEGSNHETATGLQLNVLYLDGSTARQAADDNWRGGYVMQATDANNPVWYAPYVREGTFPR